MNKTPAYKQGIPVLADYNRCGGHDYKCIPSTEAYMAVCQVTYAISHVT